MSETKSDKKMTGKVDLIDSYVYNIVGSGDCSSVRIFNVVDLRSQKKAPARARAFALLRV